MSSLMRTSAGDASVCVSHVSLGGLRTETASTLLQRTSNALNRANCTVLHTMLVSSLRVESKPVYTVVSCMSGAQNWSPPPQLCSIAARGVRTQSSLRGTWRLVHTTSSATMSGRERDSHLLDALPPISPPVPNAGHILFAHADQISDTISGTALSRWYFSRAWGSRGSTKVMASTSTVQGESSSKPDSADSIL